jgi:bisanhydrobacterioruberin hydratase
MNVIRKKIFGTDTFQKRKERIQSFSVFIAVLFHVSGVIGMHTNAKTWFIQMTPFTLILMGLLLTLNDRSEPQKFIKIFLLAFTTGYIAEFIGVNSGYLFGNYAYGQALGIKSGGVPLMIGFLWFMTIFGIGNLVLFIRNWYSFFVPPSSGSTFILANFAALLTTLFDIVLEPAAISLGYWTWDNGTIPLYNYISWYLVSAFIYLFYFKWYANCDPHKFAIILILVQLFFFLLV